jgi:hypothetical protein
MCEFLAAFGYSGKLLRADRNHQSSGRSSLRLVMFLVHKLLFLGILSVVLTSGLKEL